MKGDGLMRKLFLLLVPFILSSVIHAQAKFSGSMFGDYFYNVEASDPAKAHIGGFQFRRIYFTADFTISESFDSRFRLESDESPNSNTPGGKLGVLVKDAYLRWENVFSGSDLYFGISPTPEIDIAENAWGYRSVEKVIMDLRGIASSRDLGIDLKGKLTNDGMIKYWLKAANDSTNAFESNKSKRYYSALQISPMHNFMISLYGDYADVPQRRDPVTKRLIENDIFIAAFLLNYAEKDKYSFGVEGFYKDQQNNFNPDTLTAAKTQLSYGLSFWGWYQISDLIHIVARYDLFQPNSEYIINANNPNDKGDKINFFLAGVDFRVDKNVSIIPNIEYTTYQNLPKAGLSNDHDLMARVTFAYNF
jgi:hypothetical protein